MSNSKEEDYDGLRGTIRISVDPTIYRALRLACGVLWVLAVSNCAKLYYRPATSFDVWFAIVSFVGASALQLMYLWASKSGFMEKTYKRKQKQEFNSRRGLKRDSEK